MPLKKIYDATPLQVLTTKEVRDRIRGAAAKTGLSQAAVMRDILDHGLTSFEYRHGIFPDGVRGALDE